MTNDKGIRLDVIPIEVWKESWLRKLFNEIMRSKSMSDEWRSTLFYFILNKGDIQNYANYTMKLWERMIKHRLRQEIHLTKYQFGFMLERLTKEAIYLL